MGVIYKITSPTNRVYVGKTYDLRKRINAHKACSRKGSSIKLHNSIRKYGWSAHVLEVIEEVDDLLLNEREMYWIAELKTYCYEYPEGLNMTKGGEGQRSTWMHKTELRKWYSDKFSGKGNPFYGKTHTEASRKKISETAQEYNKKTGRKIPEWGAEKGRQKVRRPVIAYDNKGEIIAEYISLTECAKSLNVKLSSVKDSATYGSWISGKFLIKYKTDNYPIKIDPGVIQVKNDKRPVILMNCDYEEIAEFPSAAEAAVFTGVPKTTINRAAQYNNLVPIRTGHVFVYRDDYDVLFKEAI